VRPSQILLVLTVAALFGQLTAQADKPAPWSAASERTVGGPEADLVIRTGDINNLGFGWPQGFDPGNPWSLAPDVLHPSGVVSHRLRELR
jgi:hypothetical protein